VPSAIAAPSQRAVLVLHQDQLALGGGARGAARVVQQHEGHERQRLRLVGHQRGQQLAQPDRLAAQLRAQQLAPRARGIALAKDEVEHGEHGGEALGELMVGRDPEGDSRVADLALGAHQALRHRRLRHEEGPRDLRGGQPADGLQGQRDARVLGEGGMRAGEDQAQALVAEALQAVEGGVHDADRRLRGELLVLGPGGAPAAQPVDRVVARDGDEPLGRHRRHACRWPTAERHGERLLQRLLGELEVAQRAHERREHPRAVGAVDALERCVGTFAYESSRIGRTSTEPACAVGHLAASSSASSRLAQSRTK
jgi:hypothetical protein